MDIKASNRKKVLIILCITLFFSLAACQHFASKNSNIPSKRFVIGQPQFPPISGFYHFATVNRPWRGIVSEQMLLAHVSGLINASSNVYVTGLGPIEENKTIYDIFDNPKFIYEYDNSTDVYEYPTLKKVEKFCLHNNDSLVWYAHSKAASHDYDDSFTWRFIMNHFVLKKWQLCYKLLSSTNYTTCGSMLGIDTERKVGWDIYYAGNMWWAKCSHVNRLTRIERLDQSDRYLTEIYVTSPPAVGHFNCYYNEGTEFESIPYLDDINCTVNQPIWTIR
jgi:hypothetical protein